MSTLERAIALAATAHAGQTDKAGAIYILHPLRVMLRLSSLEERMAGVLHDVMEDCGISRAHLLSEGFPVSVVDAVEALSKQIVDGEEEDYDTFIRRVAMNPLATRVKLADLEDNMDLSRIPNPSDKDLRRIQKYAAAKQYLLSTVQ